MANDNNMTTTTATIKGTISLPVWDSEGSIGYKQKTTFFQDFAIANMFGEKAIRETYKRASEEWITNREYFTELVMVLNVWCWYWNDKGNERLCEVYRELYYKGYDLGLDKLNDDDLKYFVKTLD